MTDVAVADPPQLLAGGFTTVQGDSRSEVGHNLTEPVPKALSFVDQLGLWGNLGVSLLGFTGAIFVLQPNGSGTPELSLAGAPPPPAAAWPDGRPIPNPSAQRHDQHRGMRLRGR